MTVAQRWSVWLLALAVMGLTLFAVTAGDSQASYDLVITNARIIDGRGTPASPGDVAVIAGRIARVAPAGTLKGTAIIDARGLVVAPGFIDVHTHADGLADRPAAEHFIRMGVTTIVAGNCGSSTDDVEAALSRLRQVRPAVNFATFIGHNTIRSAVMGSENRAPTDSELARMEGLVERAMRAGAIGFSTGLQYTPGIYAERDEIIELARAAAGLGGIYATHMRNEGTQLEEAVMEAIAVAQATRMPLQISHLKVDSPSRWGASETALRLIDEARARGLSVAADQYAYTAGSSSLAIRFPSWALEGGGARVRERLNDAATWTRIKKEMAALVAERGFKDLSWATVASYRADPSLNGLTMTEVAERLHGASTADAQFEAARTLMLGGGASMVYHFMSEDDIARIMQHPMVGIASDAGLIQFGSGVPHPRGYGNAARVLGHYVREKQVIPLEEAVRKMTSLPASHFGFDGRGVIAAGAAADLVVFDPATVRDTATYDKPHAYPEGIVHVIVNGVVAVKGGQTTGGRGGQVITNN